MRAIENRAFSTRRTPEELMDEAGLKIAQRIIHYYPHVRQVTAYLGKGHNAGDAVVALQHLKEAGWQVNIQTNFLQRSLAPLTQKKIMALGLEYFQKQQKPSPGSVLIDGLLGIGAKGPLRDKVAGLAESINYHRARHDCTVVSIDTPSGLNGDTGEVDEQAVVADLTITIGYPKIALLNSASIDIVGAISLVTLEALTTEAAEEKNTPHLICAQSLERKRRLFSTHKGQAGRVAIWAGSEGMLGAAALCAHAALLSGAGLITVFVSPSLYPILATMVPHEVMVKPSDSPIEMLGRDFDAIAIGPGMGTPPSTIADELFNVIQQSTCPLVLDADMLNLIAERNCLSSLTQQCILTPHPGELKRLFPNAEQLTREEVLSAFIKDFPGTLLYKGARTLVSQQGAPLYVNASGSPAMASAGQGDVLTGLIAGLSAQGYAQLEATKMATWLAGEAAQIALAQVTETEETLTASTVLQFLHLAFAQVGRKQ